MKKRLLTCVLAITLVSMTPAAAFGQTGQPAIEGDSSSYQAGIITPQFAGVSTASVSISFTGSKATATVYVTPKSSSSIDYVTVKASLMKVGSSTAINSWSQTIQPNVNNNFYFSEQSTVSSSGDYYVKATVKCYKNGAIIDTLNIQSPTKAY